ncbi:hypothetical protein MMC11_002865 [Xylographa trunciseda]|nr:hypothetical protein [Xylographa trunciseda]
MSIRLATESDLDAITWIDVAATPADPVFPYRFPYMHDYPEDHLKYTRIRYGEYMATGNGTILVFESPSLENPTVSKPVAFSIWVIPGNHVKKTPEQETSETKRSYLRTPFLQVSRMLTDSGIVGCSATTNAHPDRLQRRDANPARMMAFREAMHRAKKELFDQKYGEKQLYLGMLACHPDYQRRGAGTALCQWGLDKAKAEDLTVSLFASPMGARLYSKLGFKDVASFRTQVVGEDEYLVTPGMVLETTKAA